MTDDGYERRVGFVRYTRYYFKDWIEPLAERIRDAVPPMMRPPGFTDIVFDAVRDAYEQGLLDGQRISLEKEES